ncbi:MAG: hypothetical protein BWY43_00468 [candidate division WS2 bacterium ADurb.Bin280]|uniref:Uncharacterized protein n=1 Tax=candidate division WS2 bacterium ADurb.Bin280 TaxID=1852829 RepID=A0A1V5SDN5_9BACT|nr:MAG: hypothetical protein BWY43_00468 [candidate division WS2 bacterium ADurb.Bin280]
MAPRVATAGGHTPTVVSKPRSNRPIGVMLLVLLGLVVLTIFGQAIIASARESAMMARADNGADYTLPKWAQLSADEKSRIEREQSMLPKIGSQAPPSVASPMAEDHFGVAGLDVKSGDVIRVRGKTLAIVRAVRDTSFGTIAVWTTPAPPMGMIYGDSVEIAN